VVYSTDMSGKPGVASDVYSLGVVLLELLSGRLADAYTADEVDRATDGGRDPDGLQVQCAPLSFRARGTRDKQDAFAGPES
jgi:serine/threonine protein kinase